MAGRSILGRGRCGLARNGGAIPGRVGGGQGLLCGGEGCFVNDYDDTKGTMLGFCMFFIFLYLLCVQHGLIYVSR